jgi:hypothetical protein
MSLFRVILIALAGFFAFRFIRSLVRLMAGPRNKTAGGETVGGRKKSRPLEKPFRDATDASFEDLTGTGNQQVHRDRPS